MAHHFFYPTEEKPLVFVTPRWLEVPIRLPGSIANCYLSGTGVVDFTDDPPWDWVDDTLPLITGKFRLTFTTDSPLKADDVYIPGSGIATVGLAHVDRDTDADTTDWTLALDTMMVKDVKPGTTDLQVEVTGAYRGDCWMDKIAYQIGLLVYRPSLVKKPTPAPMKARIRFNQTFLLSSVEGQG